MKRLQYKCTLLTDLVLTANSATEGFHTSLDYIPGAKFLGIVAGGLYSKNFEAENFQACLDLFHNGKVSFGDAHPLYEKERLERMPASWEMPKSKEDGSEIYLGHNIQASDRATLPRLEKGPSGYLSSNYKWIEAKQNFSIKSTYEFRKDPEKEGQMFGYFGLEKGTEWTFTIEMEEDYQTAIESVLLGDNRSARRHRIGRSKAAEYGMILIAPMEVLPSAPATTLIGKTLLYAASNWCFYDTYGRSTLRPGPDQLHLASMTADQIDWKHSYIRTRTYRTWNQHRRNRDADRLIIEKGSVLLLHLDQEVNSQVFEKGIGAHRSEGFGRVLANPWFLVGDKQRWPHSLEKRSLPIAKKAASISRVQTQEADQLVLNYLSHWARARDNKFNTTKIVNQFIQDSQDLYADISSSQWGQLRRLAKSCANRAAFKKLLFDQEIGFCYRGQSESVWRKKNRRKELENFLLETSGVKGNAIIDFTIKLTSEMAKAKSAQLISL